MHNQKIKYQALHHNLLSFLVTRESYIVTRVNKNWLSYFALCLLSITVYRSIWQGRSGYTAANCTRICQISISFYLRSLFKFMSESSDDVGRTCLQNNWFSLTGIVSSVNNVVWPKPGSPTRTKTSFIKNVCRLRKCLLNKHSGF